MNERICQKEQLFESSTRHTAADQKKILRLTAVSSMWDPLDPSGYGRRNVNFTASQCPLARLIRDEEDVETGIRHQLACRVPDI